MKEEEEEGDEGGEGSVEEEGKIEVGGWMERKRRGEIGTRGTKS